MTELVPATDIEQIRIARAAGHIALRAAPQGCTLEEDVWEPDRPFAAWGLDTCPRSFARFDFAHQCTFTIFELAQDDREVFDFVPADVEVVASPREAIAIWPVTVPDQDQVGEPLLLEDQQDGLEDDAADGDDDGVADGDPEAAAVADRWAGFMEELSVRVGGDEAAPGENEDLVSYCHLWL